MDISPIIELTKEVSVLLNKKAKELLYIAEQMEKTKDITYAGEVVNIMANIMMQARLDLFVTRTIRILQEIK